MEKQFRTFGAKKENISWIWKEAPPKFFPINALCLCECKLQMLTFFLKKTKRFFLKRPKTLKTIKPKIFRRLRCAGAFSSYEKHVFCAPYKFSSFFIRKFQNYSFFWRPAMRTALTFHLHAHYFRFKNWTDCFTSKKFL